MLALACGLSIFSLIFVRLNSFLIRTPQETLPISEKISVLLPMRNEEENVAELIHCLQAQINCENIEFLALDDNSTDGTYQALIAATSKDSRFTIISGSPLPASWLGKPWALHQLYKASTGDFLVTVDADVRITPIAISSSITLMKKESLHFFSPYPRQLAVTFSERLIQPLLQWSWLSSVPLRIAEKSHNPAFAVANGQFFISTRECLDTIDGYTTISREVLDDIELARAFIRSGATGTVGNGATIATCRMYSSWPEVRNGFAKSLHKGFGGILGSIVAIALIALTGIVPLVYGLTGSAWGWIGYEIIVLSRAISARTTRGRAVDSLLHPIACALIIYLLIYSWIMRGKIQWKGRTL